MADNISGHIAVLAFPFGSHAPAVLSLVTRLAASAPSIKFSFFSSATSNSFTFSSETAPNIKPYNISDGAPEGHDFGGDFVKPIEFFLEASPHNFKKGIEEAEADVGMKVGGLITDAILGFSCDIAEDMGVFWLPFWTSGPYALSLHMYTDLLRMKTGSSENARQNLEFIPGMSSIQIKDIPIGICTGNLEAPIAVLLHKMGQSLPRATTVVLNSFEEIDHTLTNDLKTRLKCLLNIGPSTLLSSSPPKPDDNGCLSWLDNHMALSVAYISFGSMSTPPPNELVELLAGLEVSGIPFLLSLRDNAKNILPYGFLERIGNKGKIVPWAPQLQVLSHVSVGAFVTHGGWNSILESISYGVPMICRPFFGDHMLNSATVEKVWKIGVEVEGGVFTKSGMINALDLVFSSESGNKLRENIGVIKQNVVKAVGINGSSTQNFDTLKSMVISCNKK